MVYFVSADAVGLVKIGTAKNVILRQRELQVGSPVKLTLAAIVPGDRSVEQMLHRDFQSMRSLGEWFRIEMPIVTFAKTYAFGPCLLAVPGNSNPEDRPNFSHASENVDTNALMCNDIS